LIFLKSLKRATSSWNAVAKLQINFTISK